MFYLPYYQQVMKERLIHWVSWKGNIWQPSSIPLCLYSPTWNSWQEKLPPVLLFNLIQKVPGGTLCVRFPITCVINQLKLRSYCCILKSPRWLVMLTGKNLPLCPEKWFHISNQTSNLLLPRKCLIFFFSLTKPTICVFPLFTSLAWLEQSIKLIFVSCSGNLVLQGEAFIHI